jgi:hypothetical protein
MAQERDQSAGLNTRSEGRESCRTFMTYACQTHGTELLVPPPQRELCDPRRYLLSGLYSVTSKL